MLFEWCVQALPSGHVGPPATAGKKRRFGKGLHKRRWWHGRSSSQEVEAYLALGGLCITLAVQRWRGCRCTYPFAAMDNIPALRGSALTSCPARSSTYDLGHQASKTLSETFLACCSLIPRHFHLAHPLQTYFHKHHIPTRVPLERPFGVYPGYCTYTPHPFGP